MRNRHFLTAAILGLTGLAPLSALAQSVSFGPERSTISGGEVIVNLTVPLGGTGAQTLNVTYAGDLAFAPEFIEVSVEGTVVATLEGGGLCDQSFTQDVPIPDSLYTAAASDGIVEITFDSPIEVAPVCRVGVFEYIAPFTAFNDGTNSAFAVQGSLTVSTPPAPAPEPEVDPEAQQETVAAARGALILSQGPERRHRIDRLTGGDLATRTVSFRGIPLVSDAPVGLDVARNSLSFAGGMSLGGVAFWAEGSAVRIDDGVSDDQTFGILHAGVDTRLGDRALLGLGLQIDRMDMTASGDAFDARGWMLGPLLTYRLNENLFFDARVAYGQIETDVTRAGGGADNYDGDRTLVQLSLGGDFDWGGFVVAPEAELGWYREESGAYVSEVLGEVGKTETSVRQAVLGVEVGRPIRHGNGEIEPFVGLSAINADIGSGTVLQGSYADALDGWSGEATLGIGFAAPGGTSWSIEGTVGGLGTDVETVGGRIALYLPF